MSDIKIGDYVLADEPLTIAEATQLMNILKMNIDENGYATLLPGKVITYEIGIGFFATLVDGKLESLLGYPAVIYYAGRMEWRVNNNVHRDDDKPAIIDSNGTKIWYKDGLKHRENDKPAVVSLDGSMSYFVNDKLHRDNDLPAEINATTPFLAFYKNGLRHREGNKPAYVNGDGHRRYFKNGILEKSFDPKTKRYTKM